MILFLCLLSPFENSGNLINFLLVFLGAVYVTINGESSVIVVRVLKVPPDNPFHYLGELWVVDINSEM
jgi:hypothetical protein